MDYRNIIIGLLLSIVLNFTIALPIDQKPDTKLVYVLRYDIKYVPVEVTEKFFEVEPFHPKNPDSVDKIILKNEILSNINNRANNIFKRVKNQLNNDTSSNVINVPLTNSTDGFETFKNIVKESSIALQNKKSHGIVVPLSAISNIPNMRVDSKDLIILPLASKQKRSVSYELEASGLGNYDRDFDIKRIPISLNENISHKIVRRQAQRQRFPMFRPIVRVTGVIANTQRFGPSRNPALVGYLTDRDFFPTVA